MKLGRSSILTKIIILALVVYAGITLASLKHQAIEAEAKRADLQVQVDNTLQKNSELQYNIEHSTDPETIEGIARNSIGLVKPNEKIFYAASN